MKYTDEIELVETITVKYLVQFKKIVEAKQ